MGEKERNKERLIVSDTKKDSYKDRSKDIHAVNRFIDLPMAPYCSIKIFYLSFIVCLYDCTR